MNGCIWTVSAPIVQIRRILSLLSLILAVCTGNVSLLVSEQVLLRLGLLLLPVSAVLNLDMPHL